MRLRARRGHEADQFLSPKFGWTKGPSASHSLAQDTDKVVTALGHGRPVVTSHARGALSPNLTEGNEAYVEQFTLPRQHCREGWQGEIQAPLRPLLLLLLGVELVC